MSANIHATDAKQRKKTLAKHTERREIHDERKLSRAERDAEIIARRNKAITDWDCDKYVCAEILFNSSPIYMKRFKSNTKSGDHLNDNDRARLLISAVAILRHDFIDYRISKP